MKKIYSLLAACAVTAIAFAQSTNLESFEALNGELPDCWQHLDADGDEVLWTTLEGNIEPHSGAGVAISESWNGNPLTPDNYLILPQLDVQAGENLSWWIAAQDPAYTAEKYAVVLSTTGTAAADFSVSLFEETLASAEWESRNVDLTEYVGQQVYIAFRHYDVTDQFVIKMDDVLYPTTVETCVITVDIEEVEAGISVNVYPNPASDVLNITTDAVNSTVDVYNTLGQVVISETLANRESRVDVSTLENGIYTVVVSNDGSRQQKQIVIE